MKMIHDALHPDVEEEHSNQALPVSWHGHLRRSVWVFRPELDGGNNFGCHSISLYV
jgi:hypothetical protein